LSQKRIRNAKSPNDIIKAMFPQTRLKNNNTVQNDRMKRNIANYQQGPRLGIINRGMLHEQILATQLGGNIIPYTVQAMKTYDKLIYIAPFSSRHLRRLRTVNRMNPGIKIYVWWIGTDVYNALHGKNKYHMQDVTRIRNVTHLAVSDTLKTELATLGVKAEVLTLIPHLAHLKPLPLPEKYTVAIYMPSTHLAFYKYEEMKKIVKATPDINYIFYGNKAKLDIEVQSNVKVRGWVADTKTVFKDCSALIRKTEHDGFPKSIIEAIFLDRYVISNQAFPKIATIGDVAGIIRHIQTRPKLSKQTREYYNKTYTMQKIKDRFGV